MAALTRRIYRLEQLQGEAAEQVPGAQPPSAQAQAERQPETNLSTLVTGPAAFHTPPVSLAPPRQAPQPAAPRPSLEARIGGQWLNRIGIIAVLIGLSYFLKLAFENNWIGPGMQVVIGIVAGLAILFWSERFRSKGYPGFAYSLKAVSFGALYLSLWAASQYYHLVPSAVTFFGMVMVTLTATALSLRQNAELLAAFALIGGFLTPVLVSTGENSRCFATSRCSISEASGSWR